MVKVRVLLVDDDALVRAGLRMILSSSEELEVVGEAFFRELGLRQTPTLSLFLDGDERMRMPGFQSPQQIEAVIAEFL